MKQRKSTRKTEIQKSKFDLCNLLFLVICYGLQAKSFYLPLSFLPLLCIFFSFLSYSMLSVYFKRYDNGCKNYKYYIRNY